MHKLRITIEDDKYLPLRATDGAAGLDLKARVNNATGSIIISPKQLLFIPTGVRIQIPHGKVGLLAARSSLCKSGLQLANGVGVIDADYRGEIAFAFRNVSNMSFTIIDGLRLGQLVITDAFMGEIEVANSLDETARGEGGFGSTGK